MAISPCADPGCVSLHRVNPNTKHAKPITSVRSNSQSTNATTVSEKPKRGLWPFTTRIAPDTKKPPAPKLSTDQQSGIEKITAAIETTKNRLKHIDAYLPTLTDKTKQQPYQAAQQRLRLRIDELQKLKHAFENNTDLTFKDFVGWQTGKPIAKQSQYDGFKYQKISGTPNTTEQINGNISQSTTPQTLTTAKSNLSSRIKSTSGKETLFLIGEEDHGDHTHPRLSIQASQHSDLRVAAKQGLNENDEGCPCCAVTGTLDLDELATAIPEIANGQAMHDSFQMADFNSPAHWGIFLGIAGPLSILGFTAAVRNMQGSWQNHKNIQKVIKALEQDIAANKDNPAAQQKLTAFRNTLRYSRMDAKFNFIVPGVINGVASSLVMSTVAAAHPLALPAIALYAAAQTGRNAYDLARSWRPYLPADKQPNEIAKTGAEKINQVTLSKCRFYAANTTAFAAFTAGATLTAISVLGLLPSLGASAIFLPIGLGLLTSGAITTGVTNNSWPRKFKPRNGELSMARALIDTQNAIPEVGRLKQYKSRLKDFKKGLVNKDYFRSKKAGYGFVASIPFLNQFAINRQRQLTRNKIAQLHLSQADQLKTKRDETLGELSGIKQTSFKDTWSSLAKLGIHQQVFSSWVNDGFYKAEMTPPVLTPENSVHDDNDADFSHEAELFCLDIGGAPPAPPFTRKPRHVHGPGCNHSSNFFGAHAGLFEQPTPSANSPAPASTTIQSPITASTNSESNSDSAHSEIASTMDTIGGISKTIQGYSLNKDAFIAWMNSEDNQQAHDSFLQALDYFLMFTWRRQLRYQQYGLIDYYWQLRKKAGAPRRLQE